MSVTANILERRKTNFVLWSPRAQTHPPVLIIGELKPGNPPTLVRRRLIPLLPAAGVANGLFAVAASACGLTDGTVYHYWIEVDDSHAQPGSPDRIAVTDPFAGSVDWRLFEPSNPNFTQPASVVKFVAPDQLVDCDPDGVVGVFADPDAPDLFATNNQLVIYELPTAWALSRAFSQPERAAATFLDAAALADERIGGANFAELQVLDRGSAHLVDLGVNAVELLPVADSRFNREWGYGTSHYLAPDYELGYPEGDLSPTANRDLKTLVNALHRQKIRFFADVVMAFGQEEPYNHIDFEHFHIDDPKRDSDPNVDDVGTSGRGDGHKELRNAFGSTLFRYANRVTSYDPISGDTLSISPAAQYMLVYLTRWMNDFRVDGLRLDSVENIGNWDFVRAFRERGRVLFADRWPAGTPEGPKTARFLVVGEELQLPMGLITSGRLDGLWNEDFQGRIRAAVLGESVPGEDFESTVRKAINCLSAGGFSDGAQAINYITKHDVEGRRHERLFTQISSLFSDRPSLLERLQIEKRIKLAFACLLTAVGIPMFLAGEEFGDEHDLFGRHGNVGQEGGKQVDPVNFSRLTQEPSDDIEHDGRDRFFAGIRRNIYEYVKALVKFRTTEEALSVNDTDFIWTDFNDGKRVLVWRRGGAAAPRPVIVVANFSDFESVSGTDYRIPTWPSTPLGKRWIDVSQGNRWVDSQFIGREAIFSWEAKVYTLTDA